MDYKIKGETLSDMANAIRSKTGSEDTMKPGDMPEAIDAVFDAGKKSEYDAFWDAYQQNGQRKRYSRAFTGEGWTNDVFRPKYDIVGLYSFTDMFRETALTGDLTELFGDVVFDSSQVGEMQNVFTNAKSLTRVGVIGLLACKGNTVGLFQNCTALVTIDCLVVTADNTFRSVFQNCTALQNLTIEGVIATAVDLHWSPLSKDSILSVFNALSTTTTGQTATFQKAAVEAAFTTEEWDALVKTKANWTITTA